VEEKEKPAEKPKAKEAEKSLGKRLQKAALSRVMKYIQSPQGMATFNKLMDAKKRTDNRLSALYESAGLPSLRGKHQVEWVVDRQAKRIRDLTGELDQIEDALKRLEKTIAAPPVEPIATPVEAVAPPVEIVAAPAEAVAPPAEPAEPVEPVAPPAPTVRRATKKAIAPQPAPQPKKTPKITPAKLTPAKKTPAKEAPAKNASAKKTPAAKAVQSKAPAKPKPLGAASHSVNAAAARKSLLDLDWKGKPKKK
jgi:hypothetical protein